ncbi:antibiotic biosynthesis monooxygenase [Gracilaria domingensis]|nr:antibiotic biosynthesis monooxygenase [Gracilaria domingensis]
MLCVILFVLFISLVYGEDQIQGQCQAPSQNVTGFSVFTCRPEDENAFIQDFASVINKSRAEPGNLVYNIYTNPTQPGVVGLIESYVDFEALATHMASEYVRSVFYHPYYYHLRSKPADLYGPWIQYVPEEDRCSSGGEPETIEMVFYCVMNCTVQHVWDVITDWEDASWELGHPNTTLVPLDENGQVMSDDEAANVPRPLNVSGGLGPVAQRRTWADGIQVDVRMLSRNDSNFTTVQETLSVTSFGGVVFDEYFVSISLDAEGLDSDLQSRMRYHIRGTVKNDTNVEEARLEMKNGFYGPLIEHYQMYFNCSKGIHMKRAEETIIKLHDALQASPQERSELLDGLYEYGFDMDGFVKESIWNDIYPTAVVAVTLPIEIFATPDLRVVAAEDIMITSVAGVSVNSRIVIYSLNEWGRIVVARVFGDSAKSCEKRDCRKLLDASDTYYKRLQNSSLKKFEELFVRNAPMNCPVSFSPSISVEELYNKGIYYNVEYTHFDERSFVNTDFMQTAQLLEAKYGPRRMKETPVEIISFDEDEKITMLESFYEPSNLDYSALEDEKE